MDDRLFGPLQALEGALDQLPAGLGQHHDRDVVGNQVFLDQLAEEVEVGLRSRREADLDLLEADAEQEVEEPLLAGAVHGIDQRLVAVAKVDGAPDRRLADGLGRPGSIRQLDRRIGPVFVDRHRAHLVSSFVLFSAIKKPPGPKAVEAKGDRTGVYLPGGRQAKKEGLALRSQSTSRSEGSCTPAGTQAIPAPGWPEACLRITVLPPAGSPRLIRLRHDGASRDGWRRSNNTRAVTMAGDMSAEALRSRAAAGRLARCFFIGDFRGERPRCRTMGNLMDRLLQQCHSHKLDVGA